MKWAEAKHQVVPEAGDEAEEKDNDDQWSLTAGVLEQRQHPDAPKPQAPKELSVPGQNEWHFGVTSNGEIEHYRVGNGKVGVREAADKIHIVERSDEAFTLALERAQSRFGQHLHFDGNQAGVERLINLVVEKNLQVTFTNARINASIELARAQEQLVPGRDAGIASVSTPEKKSADTVNQTTPKEILVEHGDVPFEFQAKNKANYFVRTISDTGAEKLYWGKDLPRALEESGAKIGDLITAQRTGTKLVTVKELQELKREQLQTQLRQREQRTQVNHQ